MTVINKSKKNGELLDKGMCTCICEPRGDNGLESFQLNDICRYELIQGNLKKYYKVFIVPELNYNDHYYETCIIMIFKQYFKKL